MVADAPLREEGLLGGRYVLEGVVGRGGMADVYRAHDLVLGRAVAVKMLRVTTVDEKDRARFTDEARTLAKLNHPGLVTILDAAVTDHVPYQVMELVEGPSLAECCRAGALEPARVAAIGAQLADALEHAHAAGIVHRDLKPGNVLLCADDRALLTDFGIARLMSAVARHTGTGATIGTPAYLAPEQVRGRDVTPATDVYALGLVLLEALTGRRAYRGAPVEAALARLTAPPTIPEAVPAAWHDLLRAMTASEPAERPSAAAVAATLRGLASGVDPAAATAALRVESGHRAPPAGAAGADRDRGAGDTPTQDHLTGPRPHGLRYWVVGAVVAALALVLYAVAMHAGARGRGVDRAADRPAPAAPLLSAPAAPERPTDLARETPEAVPVAGDVGGGQSERQDDAEVEPPSRQADASDEEVATDDSVEALVQDTTQAEQATGNGKPKKDTPAPQAQRPRRPSP